MGIDAELIDLRTIRPMDLDTVIASVKKTNRLVIVEEGFPQVSVGDHIANQVSQRAFDFLDAPVITIAGKDVPMPYAANLEKLALPNVGGGHRGGQSRHLSLSQARGQNANQHHHAGALADDGRRQSCQMAGQGGRQGFAGRRHRRDRDRQGDDGGRGRR